MATGSHGGPGRASVARVGVVGAARLAAVAVLGGLVVLGGAGAFSGPASGAGAAPGGGPGAAAPSSPLFFAPYVDVTADSPPFPMAAEASASGTKDYTLGFVVSEGGCHASWGGRYPLGTGYLGADIAALRAEGGEVVPSFGGAAGVDLADACATAAALEAQYQAVVTREKVTRLDFDIEGGNETDQASLARRFAALTLLEEADPGLSVSLTLPVELTGLGAAGLDVMKTAIADGVHVAVVNLMTMDYGSTIAPHPAGKMGIYAVEAARATAVQLARLYPSLSAARIWSMIGITPMIGQNDVANEVFGIEDAEEVEAFATSVGLGRLSMWAATRDVECPGGVEKEARDTCSGIEQKRDAFEDIFVRYAG